ncbi:hypothetical protein DVR12_01090 [Chitinophaga silvatica]|uniref:PAS domain-containing protein n=1 Tax=Chitinophaga silvatica TaxID=2282649 RepID=A0A3E1YG80_9BACT|nr:hypothetical protein [Chitinophaga silvatica]RFS26413.1 hypothetical protein DVR12_01090 [Chitinophaga silvatica]
MSTWVRKALDFVNQTGNLNKDKPASNIWMSNLQLVRQTTEADIILLLDFEDEETAKVKFSLPGSFNDFILTPTPIQQLIRRNGSKILYWDEIPALGYQLMKDILKGISSLVLIPLNSMSTESVLLIGWESGQDFNSDFKDCIETIKIRLKETKEQTRQLTYFQKIAIRYSAILHHIPHALVFVNSDGFTGWVNDEAAALLRLASPGDQLPAILSDAMTQLRDRAINREEIYKKAIRLFSYMETVTNWEWQMEDRNLLVSCIPIDMQQLSGRLWIFEERNK